MTTKKILLIYHKSTIRDLLEACLTDFVNWNVQIVSTNLEGLERAKSYQPDAIILDFSLLEIDESFFKQLRTQPTTKKIPVVLLSTRAKWFDLQRIQQFLQQNQAAVVIVNPLDPKLIPFQIANTLGWDLDSQSDD